MEKQTLQAEVRAARGKGPARRLRAQGKLPAVYYGPGLEPTPLTVDPVALERHLRGPLGRNTLFEIEYYGKTDLAMVRDLTVEPVSRELLHADFYRVTEDTVVTVDVPFKTKGRPIGVVKGGMLTQTRRSVPVKTTPTKIPAFIEVDVSKLDMFETLSVGDVALEAGEITLPPELSLVLVGEDRRAKRLAEKEAKEAEAAGEAAPAAEA